MNTPVWKTIKTNLRLLSPRITLAAILCMTFLFTFIFIVHETFEEKENALDAKLVAYILQYQSPGLIKVMRAVSFFGSSPFLLPAYLVVCAYFLLKRRRGYSINIALMGIGSTILLHILKLVFHRHRPASALDFGLHSYSFPSGHSVSSFIFFSILAWLAWRTNWAAIFKWLISTFLFVFALLVGVSRVALGVHYPSDVLAGFVLGITWIAAVWWGMVYFTRHTACQGPTPESQKPGG